MPIYFCLFFIFVIPAAPFAVYTGNVVGILILQFALYCSFTHSPLGSSGFSHREILQTGLLADCRQLIEDQTAWV